MSYVLTDAQVFELNERHGWFQYNDAQSDVSKAFAQDAIDMYEGMRKAAPQLLAALKALVNAVDNLDPQSGVPVGYQQLRDAAIVADAAIAKATGAA